MVLNLMKLIAMKVVRFENGEMTIYDRNMVIVPAEMLVDFREILGNKLGWKEADGLMLEAGRGLTVKSTRRYVDKKKELRPVFQTLTTGDPSIEMGREVFKMSGLGDIRIVEVSPGADKYVIATKNSPLAKEYLRTRGKSDSPACSFLMGIICGVLHGYRDAEFTAKELRCRATGTSDECVFEFRKSG